MATFSVTDVGTFRACRRKWDWSSNARQNLTGIGSGAEPLELGGLIHRALADWIMEPKPQNVKLGDIFLVHASRRQDEITEAFERTTHRKIGAEDLESLHNVVMLGRAMMENYQAYHKTPLPSHIRFAMPEQEVLVPVPGTEHHCSKCEGTGKTGIDYDLMYKDQVDIKVCTDCNGTGIQRHYLSATLDGLLQDEKDRLLVAEHKTYENRPSLIDLYMNDQFSKYAWVASQLKIGYVLGVGYDGMWKREKPPKYMQKERRPGTMSDLFIRKIIEKSPESIAETGVQLAKEINDMANDPAIYPNVPWQGCKGCAFIEPCRMLMMGEDPAGLIKLRYTQRETIVRGGANAN